MTKTAGLVGGIAPESTIAYYRLIIANFRERTGGRNPSIVINSIDLAKMLGFVGGGDFAGLVNYLSDELKRVADAGAHFGAFASNTPHLVFDDLAARSPIPLISIVESTARVAKAAGVRRAGLLGTRFTMAGRFYPEVFARHEMEIVPPNGKDLEYVHEKYMSELVNARFEPATRAELLHVVDRLRHEQSVDAVILGGTELPLILGGVESGVPLLDTTEIHVREIVSGLI